MFMAKITMFQMKPQFWLQTSSLGSVSHVHASHNTSAVPNNNNTYRRNHHFSRFKKSPNVCAVVWQPPLNWFRSKNLGIHHSSEQSLRNPNGQRIPRIHDILFGERTVQHQSYQSTSKWSQDESGSCGYHLGPGFLLWVEPWFVNDIL